MKYGIICYDYLENIGNEIQSIAARRFLPQVDYYLNYNNLSNFNLAEEEFKIIMNAWYLHEKKSLPPKDEYINPLLISMHLTVNNRNAIEAFLTEESKEFLRKYGPVGARDPITSEWLNEHDIPAYFSGCLTLTLQGNEAPKDDYILLVDVPNELIPFIKSKTDKKVYVITHETPTDLDKRHYPPNLHYLEDKIYNSRDKFFIAENYLKLYERASCVITKRLHVALPCLAFKTPVMVISDNIIGNRRFTGFKDMLNFSNLEEYKNNYNMFDVNNPPENSKDYLKIRKDLIKKCSDFTGHINPTYYSFEYNNDTFMKQNILMLNHMNSNLVETNEKFFKLEKENQNLREYNEKLENKIKQKNKTIKSLKNERKEILSSNSWKITKPLRNIGKLIK